MPGVLELLPLEQVAFQRMVDTIRSGFERFGYLPISTPTMELAEVLLRKTGGESERQVYLAQSTGAVARGHEPDLALRFDLTVPLARYVAEHQARLSFPFRRYQIQPVFRGESPQQGRFREFLQCDIDAIGHNSLSLRYDAEMPAVIDTVFGELGVGDFVIRINNRRLLKGLINKLAIPAEHHALVLREIDKLERKGAPGVIDSLVEGGVKSSAADRLIELVGMGLVPGAKAGDFLASIDGDDPQLVQGRSELAQVVQLVGAQGVDADRFGVDLSIARGLDYYTGTVYETTLTDRPGLGSICSGGRYDDLANHYTDSKLPGVGISIGLTRLFWQLEELGLIDATSSPVDVLVGLIDEEGVPDALAIASRLRAGGINTEVVLEASKVGRQLKYADRARIRFLVLAGPDERSRGHVMLRDLMAQTQEEVAVSEVLEAVRRRRGETER
jgi:histidyl-tRNA synthetase